MSVDYQLPELAALAKYSAQIGGNPLLIQSAGGNTSVKDGNTMWIKASGTELVDAVNKPVFVAVDYGKILDALHQGLASADQPAEFLLEEGGLRPSIETSLHALFKQKVVIHVHCVNTIALAIRKDAEAALGERLKQFDWVFVPYVKPGANLARSLLSRITEDTNVVVLGNHGLIVAGDTVDEVATLLENVVEAVSVDPPTPRDVDIADLESIAKDSDYSVPPQSSEVHQLALSELNLTRSVAGSYYPDHVIFCGRAANLYHDQKSLEDGHVFLIVPGKGILLRKDASNGMLALSRCLADVLSRVGEDAELVTLTSEQENELIDWDAEKYRKSLNKG